MYQFRPTIHRKSGSLHNELFHVKRCQLLGFSTDDTGTNTIPWCTFFSARLIKEVSDFVNRQVYREKCYRGIHYIKKVLWENVVKIVDLKSSLFHFPSR